MFFYFYLHCNIKVQIFALYTKETYLYVNLTQLIKTIPLLADFSFLHSETCRSRWSISRCLPTLMQWVGVEIWLMSALLSCSPLLRDARLARWQPWQSLHWTVRLRQEKSGGLQCALTLSLSPDLFLVLSLNFRKDQRAFSREFLFGTQSQQKRLQFLCA